MRPAAPRRFVLATHFDTRPWADESSDPALHHKPVPGANDGTSGLAVILELAPRLVAALPDDIGFSIALFDGEELGRPEVGGYCAGSRRLVDVIDEPRYATLRAASFGIVLDMIGDADLQLRREPYSERAHPALVDHLWRTAARGGYDSFERAELPAQLDDHVYLSRAGVPSVLLLDRDYPAWHTTEDTLERVSARSLGTVSAVVLAALLSYPWPDDDAGPRGAAARGR